MRTMTKRYRTTLLAACVLILAGCGRFFRENPLASTCAESCYKLEGQAQAECLSRCREGR